MPVSLLPPLTPCVLPRLLAGPRAAALLSIGLLAAGVATAQVPAPAAPAAPAAASAAAARPVAGKPAAVAAPPRAPAATPGLQFVTEVEGIREYRLANGLQLLLIPDASKPTTTVNMTYRVGSRHENYGETGMAHLLEHLLFKGSPRHPNVWSEFTKRGLSANGSTAYDRTNYFASFAANPENLRWYLFWQADAMVNSFIARKDLDSEMTVVRNEMEMGENDPFRILYQQTLGAMFKWHNYGKAPIGARSDVEGVDIARLQAFYRQYYQPDNATLIVSGAFDEAQVKRWVVEAFAPIPRPKRTLPKLYTVEPVQDGPRAVTLERVGGTPLLIAGYRAPAGGDADYAAVEALTLILADTPSGRLHKRLTEGGLAASVFGFAQDLHDPGFAVFGAEIAPGQDVAVARDALLKTLESLREEPVTQAELDRAKAKWLKAWDLAFTNPQRVGVSLSESVAAGDWRLFFLQRDRVKALKLADVQRVGEQMLLASSRTLAEYRPTTEPQRSPLWAAPDLAQALQGYRGQAAVQAAEVFDPTPANLDARTRRFELPVGLKGAVIPKATRGQVVQAQLVLNFGDEHSLFGWGDAPAMLAALLDKGTARLSREQIQDRLDELQTELGIASQPGQLVVTLVSRREHLPAALALVGELLRQPALPPAALEELRSQSLAALQAQRKEPEALVANALERHGNPYPAGDVRRARSFDEMEADLRAVTLQQVREFHGRFYGASHAEFAAVGDLDEAAVRQALQQALGDWASPEAYARVPEPLYRPQATRMVLPTPDKQSATLSARLPVALSDRDADYPLLMLANHLLGSGGDSRLWTRVREKEGLSYSLYSAVQWNPDEPHSVWMASANFAPQNLARVEAAMKAEIDRALKDGFTAAELEAGKRSLLSFRRLSRASDGRVAGALASNLHRGRSFADSARVDAAIAAATLEQVNGALRRHLTPQALVWAAGGDFRAATAPAR